MIYRFMFTGFYGNKNITVPPCPEVFFSVVSYFRDRFFVYIESEQEEIDPETLIAGDRKPFPDGTHTMRMASIFHYATPTDAASWKRTTEKTPWVRVALLRYDKVDCYTFYHYKLQEEGECNCDVYGSIYLLGNLLISYNEFPMETGRLNNPCTLATKDIPYYQGDIINDLAYPWPEYPQDRWQPIELGEISEQK